MNYNINTYKFPLISVYWYIVLVYVCFCIEWLSDLLSLLNIKKSMHMLQSNDTCVTYIIFSDVYVFKIDHFNMLNR